MKRAWLLAALLILLAGCREKPKDAADGTNLAHQSAPDFILPDILSNETVQLSKLKGKVVVLDFWATWCAPCRQEIPGFVELQKKYGPRGLRIVGVSLDEPGDKDLVRNFAREWGVNYRVVMDGGKVASAYGDVRSIPTTFVIGKDGKVAGSHTGFNEKEVFEKEILAALEVK